MTSQPIYNITINQNATFKMSVQLTDESGSALAISGWQFSGSLKANYDDPDPPVAYFSASVESPSQSLLTFTLTPTQTGVLDSQCIYYYDLIAVNYTLAPDEVYRILQGKARISPGVTDAHINDF